MINILYNLWKLKRRASPEKEFKNNLWNELKMNLPADEPLLWYRQTWYKWSLVGAACVLVVASFGTGVYAYNSPEVTEGTLLYAVKQTIEKVEEATKYSPEAKTDFLEKKVLRRQAEKQVMQKRGQSVEKMNKEIIDLEKRLHNSEIELFKKQNQEEKPAKIVEDKKENNYENNVSENEVPSFKGRLRNKDNK